MAKNRQDATYVDRATLDAELNDAIADILSAEEQAKRIVAQAEEQAKSVRADGASRERELREKASAELAAERDRAVADAIERAVEERKKRVAAARVSGEQLIESKTALVGARIKELYAELSGGK